MSRSIALSVPLEFGLKYWETWIYMRRSGGYCPATKQGMKEVFEWAYAVPERNMGRLYWRHMALLCLVASCANYCGGLIIMGGYELALNNQRKT